ncbi:MAG: NADPH-dependent FMN reductase [Saprospiraceae bacterium]
MKKILAIGASNSKQSINKKLAIYVANKIENATINIADLNELTLPLYSPDVEAKNGIPNNALKFRAMIDDSDAIVLSLAEYNGMITTAFKNIWDWSSRVDMKIWKNKPMFLMAASPGGRGGVNALKVTKKLLPHFGGNVITDFSLPLFFQNFSEEGIKDENLNNDLINKINLFQNSLNHIK